MVVETEIKTFLEWLLGDAWAQAALWQGGALLGVLVVVAGLAVALLATTKSRPQWLGNLTAGFLIFLLVIAGLAILAALPVGFGVLIGWTAPWEAVKSACFDAGSSLLAWSNWLLGVGNLSRPINI